jgi:rhamnosyltransferase
LNYSLLIPTLNAGPAWITFLEEVAVQTLKPEKKIIIDSGSSDDTVALAKEAGFEVIQISKNEFRHGASRQQLVNSSEGIDICVFLTQDAILASPDSLKNLVHSFKDPEVGLAYGRQLPHKNATTLETHARLFNYPDRSVIRSFADKDTLGFKVFFCSNSFSAYRRSALNSVGGFPLDPIMGEDAIVAATMLKAGFKMAYVADATAYHSHSYTLAEEYRRYFDTRVFHEQNNWLIKEYGKPTGEGLKFVRSELNYVIRRQPAHIVKSISSIFAKWLGYKMGGFYRKMPLGLLKKLSMHKHYWK